MTTFTADSFQKHLTQNIIPFWNACKDSKHGGFCGYVGHDLQKVWESDKGVILHSRILWFYSSAYTLLQEPELLAMADYAYDFIRKYCLDKEYGGMFWSVSCDGQPSDDTKHTYNQAFAIYALSAYYEASRREDALNMAYGLCHVIEERCRDSEGYLEAFKRDFTPASNEKLSENGVMAERTMNTLLHVMEAYTELYRVDGRQEIRDALCQILEIFYDKVYNPGKGICEVFFDRDYHTLIDLESFGHDIEAAWLLQRTVQVLDDETWTSRILPVTARLSEAAYEHAYDPEQGCLYNERERDKTDRQRIWWVQAEAVVGFYNMYQAEPEHEKYLRASESVWQFIQEHMVDGRSGEWFESVKEDGSVDVSQGIVHAWKCPYHNGRMCMEMIRRLKFPLVFPHRL
jgi:mannobiose 2-epimerase